MPPEAGRHALAAEWLRYARSNLAIARRATSPDVIWDHLCFEAQQAAEKAVKAVLVYRSVEFPVVHDIRQLMTLVEESGPPPPDQLWEAAAGLTPYAVLARYPGFDPPATQETHARAVELAEQLLRWAESVIRGA